jgi:acetyl-CoA carboxylase biotin carboxyl carrier protein
MSGPDQPGPAACPTPPHEHTLRAVERSVQAILDVLRPKPLRLMVRAGEVSIELEWPPAGTGGPVEQTCDDADPLGYITASTVGTFYRSPEPGAAPFVEAGDQIEPGQQVAVIEAMKLLVPVEADRHGVIADVLRPDAAAVEYGERLFSVAADQLVRS